MTSNGIDRKWTDLLAEMYRDHPDWNAAQFQRQLVIALGEKKAPGLSAVQKRIPKTREEYRKLLEAGLLDPWHLGLLSKHPEIPAEAVPYILMVQKWAESHPDRFGQPHEQLSVRQALWIARLYSTAVGTVRWDKVKKPKDVEQAASEVSAYLWEWSEAYARRETINDLGGSGDTIELDRDLRTGGRALAIGKTILTYHPGSFNIAYTADKDLHEQITKDGEQ